MSILGSIADWLPRRDQLADWLRQLRDWWRGGGPERGVLVLGPGGVGKSTFALLVAGEYNFLAEDLSKYAENLGVEHYTLAAEGGRDVGVVVPPGQIHRREATWAGLLREVVAGKFRGIVLVGAYGYHSLGGGINSWKYHPFAKQHQDEASFLRAFAEERREDEIAVLLQLADALKLNKAPVWLLTLVTKEDLWWGESAVVEKHYREGRYGKALVEVAAAHDPARFRHEFAFASLVISNLVTSTGELLRPNTAGYDHRLFARSVNKLLETVDQLRKWEVVK